MTSSSDEAHECYHCGLPVPVGTDFTIAIAGATRRMCCPGCVAVASAIVSSGLDGYYTRRDSYPASSPREALPAAVRDLEVFDRPEIEARFVAEPSANECEATLILEEREHAIARGANLYASGSEHVVELRASGC